MNQPTPESTTLRLLWPQWQGAGPEVVAALAPELPLAAAHAGYSLGARLLDVIAPAATGPTAVVPVAPYQEELGATEGIFGREQVIEQLRAALDLIEQNHPDRIVTLGGECSVSVAPFAYLAERYGDDLAVIWMDAHPDVGLPSSAYDGYHAMAVSHLLGKGDPTVTELLPATIDPSRIALAGLHAWEEDDIPHVAEWGLTSFSPEQLRSDPEALVAWLLATGCSKVAIHLDLDAIDSNERVFGLGMEPGGLATGEVVSLLAAVSARADVVSLTVAEYIPRQAIALQQLVRQLPLLGDSKMLD